jgi:hypothetical protein
VFRDRINIENIKDIRYGHTTIAYQRTFGQVLGLLDKHGCTKTMTYKEGDINKIGFELDNKPYIINIPRVYVKGVYDDKLGIRLVFRTLEALLELTKQRVVDFEFLMLGSRIVHTPEGNKTLKEAVEQISAKQLFEPPIERKEIEGEIITIEE